MRILAHWCQMIFNVYFSSNIRFVKFVRLLKTSTMNDDAILCLEEAEEKMQHAIEHLEREFQKIRAGKASPGMLNGVRVEYYGVSTPIEQTSNINTPDPRQIIVQPFDKSVINDIEKAIQNANLGFNPQNEGTTLASKNAQDEM